MSTPINLNQFRKDKARKEARAVADANAVKFGRTKAQRALEEARAAKAEALLAGHRGVGIGTGSDTLLGASPDTSSPDTSSPDCEPEA